MRKWIIGGLLVLAMGVVATLLISAQANDRANRLEPPANSSPQTAVVAENPEILEAAPKLIIGDPNAPITITEYGDYQCPICKQFFDTVEPELRAAYIGNGKAQIEFRIETHIGEESILAGEAAYCAADQDKFPAMHDSLYANQNGYDAGAFSAGALKRYAGGIGLNQAQFDSCLDTHQYRDAVLQSDAAADQVISATPTFFIGEERIVGAQPFALFDTILRAQ